MQANNFSLRKYCERIGYEEEPKANEQTLKGLIRHQLMTVPFENLDVQAGKVVSLVPEEIVEKIINRNRGGYCYEVNGLFGMALEILGIEYQFVAARPMFYPVKRPKTHMAIIAKVDGRDWLCDLGFGSYGIRAPMDLAEIGKPIKQDHDVFMLEKLDTGEYLLKAYVDDAWANQCAFDLHSWEWIDFAPANYMNSTHPDAIFVQKRLVIIQNLAGRTILLGDSLKTIQNGLVTKREVGPKQIGVILETYFDLALL
ncbi:arylamine N-acetyltransferase [Polynucleobacter sp. JS-Safj-400b-B2]|uniref:arylamine N-acetyltransferase family protein n=1 Tax=Polynucleobacter sp. JS-Safj-400b-B2 TaxID=2576921 RepID=UPI001C0E3123|nr:arylamine N-acetyltransferase [Polynucleobacter sp. JS-Safj-400b-B2]MBU3625516.1 arylamine N-acetyltransferase [Polynucleobacter sp. JS-Safj-400b-B2]